MVGGWPSLACWLALYAFRHRSDISGPTNKSKSSNTVSNALLAMAVAPLLSLAACSFTPAMRPILRVSTALLSSAPISAVAADTEPFLGASPLNVVWEFIEDHDLNTFGLFYAGLCALVYATIYLRAGTSNVVYRGGTVYKDNKAVEQPFKRTAADTAKAVAEGLRKAANKDDGGE